MVIQSNIVRNGALVSFNEWSYYIDTLKEEVDGIYDEQTAINVLDKDFTDAVKRRLPKKRFGIFFSGGVDSTLIAHTCRKFTDEFICYTVGIKGSKDVNESKKVAHELGLKHRIKVLDLDDMEILFKKTASILQENLDVVNLGVGAVEIAALELARKDNIDTFFGGLGSEEIYAGYKRHEDSDNINEECWKGLKTMHRRDFGRDYSIASSYNANFLTPFLDKHLIIDSMKVPGELKIKDPCKKYIIRKVALSMGIPEKFAFRKKIAAQYGSRFDNAIKKIAKKHGFKYKRQYIENLRSM